MSTAARALSLVLLATSLAMPTALDAAGAEPAPFEACGGRPLHPPIEIREDVGPAGFLLAHDPLTGDAVPRPGTGVTGGAGTADDPYVIEGWCVVGARTLLTSSSWGITLLRTEAHVVLRDNVVLSFDRGIYVYEAANVLVEQNDARDSGVNVVVERSPGIVVRGNHVAGGILGIVMEGTERALLVDNVVHGTTGGAAISLFHASDSEARGNEVFGVARPADGAIKVEGGARNLVVANHVHDNLAPGVSFGWTRDGIATENRLLRNGDGIVVARWTGSQVVRDNDIRDNERAGVRAIALGPAPSGTLLVQGNDLVGNGEAGVDATRMDGAVDARHNWWGCAHGPSDAACDRVLGALVAYEPWLTEPNVGTGAAAG